MYEVVAVSFLYSNNIYYFDVNSIPVCKDKHVIVEIDEDKYEIGICKTNMFIEKENNLDLPLKKVIRLASSNDMERYDKNNFDSREALKEAKIIAKSLKLSMNFISASYTFDRSQLYFSYLSDERVDFRELAKKLAQKYKTRIELRQIGVRDKAKLIGGIGPCGLFLCCNTFLTDFNSVSINMAKNQFLALNPNKINGVCGRLLCCLNYENDQYTEMKKDLPKVGSYIETDVGVGKVISVDIFRKNCKLEVSKGNYVELPCEDFYEGAK